MKLKSIVCILFLFSMQAKASCLDEVAKFSLEICGEIDRGGINTFIDAEGKITAQSSRTIKKFLGAVEGEVSARKKEESFRGVLQEHLGPDLIDLRKCKEDMARIAQEEACREYEAPLKETKVTIPGTLRFLNGQLLLKVRKMVGNGVGYGVDDCFNVEVINDSHRFSVIIEGTDNYRREYKCLMQGQDAQPHFKYNDDTYMLRVGALIATDEVRKVNLSIDKLLK